ncbi:MAG TPA: hypothetical protein VG842_03590, partial [Sediminibacterium sp.]|nr:hypothetical protein [Sediminibacterium sp.]
MVDIICIGPVTLDKIITPGNTAEMAGGTSYYFSKAIRHTGTGYHLITSLSVRERRFVDDLRNEGIPVTVYASAHTHFFENIYPANTDHRVQRILGIGDPFPAAVLADINASI